MSDGGYRRDEEGRLQLRADFYHPAGGYGYVAEVAHPGSLKTSRYTFRIKKESSRFE
jgi:hypothetical protein